MSVLNIEGEWFAQSEKIVYEIKDSYSRSYYVQCPTYTIYLKHIYTDKYFKNLRGVINKNHFK